MTAPNRRRFATMEAERLQTLGDAEPTTRPAKKTLDQQLHDHQAGRPEMPRPFVAASPEAIAFQRAFQTWLDDGDDLARRVGLRDRQTAGKACAQRVRGAS